MRILYVIACFTAAAFASAQSSLYTYTGSEDWEDVGSSVALLGDCTGDGVPDFALSSNPNGAPAEHQVFSGADGTVVHEITGPAGSYFGKVAGVGDVNADGFADFAIGTMDDDEAGPSSGTVRVYSGIDAAELFLVYGASYGHMGVTLDGAGDVNGDGFDDVIVGAPSWQSTFFPATPVVVVLSGVDGTLLHFLEGNIWDGFGTRVAGLGDVDADGFDDFAVASTSESSVAPGAGRVEVYSGDSGDVIHTWYGISSNDALGSIAGPGDVNGDGHADVLLGTPQGTVGIGYVQLRSGADGAILQWKFGPNATDGFGRRVAGAGDVDGDGTPDYCVASWQLGSVIGSSYGPGYVRVYSGDDGTLLQEHNGLGDNDGFGAEVDGGVDVNGDGAPELLVYATAYGEGITGAGRAILISTADVPLTGDVPTIDALLGGSQALTLDAGTAFAGELYLVLGTVLGTEPGIPLPTGVLPLNDSPYLAWTISNPNQPPLSNSLGTLDFEGRGTAAFQLGPVAIPGALTGHHAFVVLDGSDVTFISNAAPVTLVP